MARPAEPNGVPFHSWVIENGYSSKWIAEQLGLCRSTIDKYRQGVNFPSPYILRRMAERFGLTKDVFVKRSWPIENLIKESEKENEPVRIDE